MRKIKLALCDDHTLFRIGMATIVGQIHDFELVLEAGNGQELIDKIPRKMPDVVLLDLQMPVMDGTATADYLREHYPLIKIVVLTMHDEDRMVLHLLEKGVSGYLLKDAEAGEVEKAVRKVMDEGVYLNEFVSKAMLRKMTNKTTVNKPVNAFYNSKVLLSEREKEVLMLICEGLSTNEISEKIFLSPRTVEGHRLRILEKTGTKNTAGMVAYAFKNDLVSNTMV
ncbi:response regulator transcription factor [Spirosoma luteum]|uniref:response regulator transcription factor n=1 Tax=Spirosoma luteum TaxID=431553 RepID=UPI000373ED5E|nr:response regulator transcription factor [Spirosoma luteum]